MILGDQKYGTMPSTCSAPDADSNQRVTAILMYIVFSAMSALCRDFAGWSTVPVIGRDSPHHLSGFHAFEGQAERDQATHSPRVIRQSDD